MNLWSVLCLFGLLCLLGYTEAKGKKPDIDQDTKGCLQMVNKTSKLKMACDKRHVIYNVDIKSFTSGTCRQPGPCFGLQPEVLTASNMCYWSRSCQIRHSSWFPIVATDNIECLGRSPKLLTVQYSCIKKKKIIFMKDRVSINKILDLGMIVSHSNFPWYYKPGTVASLNLKAKSPSVKKLFLTVLKVDIDSRSDLVRVEHGKTTTNITATGNLFIRASEAKFDFLVDNDSSAAKGFVLCFYWAEECENLSNQDICEKVKRLKRRPKKPCRRGKKRQA